MKFATWNVNSVTARLPLILRWLEAARPDVVCLQETKCTDQKFPHAAFVDTGYESVAFGQPTYNGVAILARRACEQVRRGFSDPEFDQSARLVAATVGGVRVINVYVPNGGQVGADKYHFKLEWIRRLRRLLDTEYQQDEHVLLCGDFNVAPEDRDVHDPELWRGQILVSDPERAALDEVRRWGLVDVFRLHNQDSKHFSWWDYRAGAFRRNLGLRIDHIWTTEPLAARSTAAWIDRETRAWERPSDHAPVMAEFDLGDGA